ncbi:MAG: hypothetical protein ACXWPM_13055, partial [Bdellovibrionota bacterium]
QVAAVFHLLEKGRERPALSLCRSALLKLKSPPLGVRVEISGAVSALEAVQADPSQWQRIASALRAHLFEPAS